MITVMMIVMVLLLWLLACLRLLRIGAAYSSVLCLDSATMASSFSTRVIRPFVFTRPSHTHKKVKPSHMEHTAFAAKLQNFSCAFVLVFFCGLCILLFLLFLFGLWCRFRGLATCETAARSGI